MSTEEWTINGRQLRCLYAIAASGSKGLPTAGKNTNAAVTYATAEALERRELVRISVVDGDYRVHATEAGEQYAAKMWAQGRR